ncbi:(S)-2-hydroxy-acid oxidase [Ketogulonicigenium vulgare Y25]|uniref:alpha-hydroxy acid oxidase n=1 Tax=Ketogulonicigenium vulgare TaxID=92945 RepID=UPI0001E6795E|nr:alpha-hydroxy acid oxidase [Ketogulonicigenium vulgare]ADO41468.1 (S)-2-hydroxy-acid oxidase [Ketogulonicigenium vulgare Y25]
MNTDPIDNRYATGERFTTNLGIWRAAREACTDEVWNYLNCGTGDEVTLRANTADFDKWQWKTPLFAGIGRPDTATQFLGHSLSFPAFIAPFGGGEYMLDAEGHRATGRAARDVGIRQIVPVAAAHSLEDIATASGVAQMFQVTFVGDVGAVVDMMHRAKAAGYEQIVATYSPIRQWRERMIEDRTRFAPGKAEANFGPGLSDPAALREQIAFSQPRWGWAEAREAIARAPLPILVKGVMSADEAKQCLDAGAMGLYVSNYGGRSIDRQPSAISALPQVRAAAGPDVPIIFDSGIRRGSDIAAAVALGANAVALRRAVGFGLAADGEAGVRRVLQILKDEYWTTLGHLGCNSTADLGPHVFI